MCRFIKQASSQLACWLADMPTLMWADHPIEASAWTDENYQGLRFSQVWGLVTSAPYLLPWREGAVSSSCDHRLHVHHPIARWIYPLLTFFDY